jgi:N-acetylglucosaminyldiphosphoundecaprenol N-acetyl-beta-D-mannosaminyltransferase
MEEPGFVDRIRELPLQNVMGVPIHAIRATEAVQLCREAAAHRTRLMIGVVNGAKLVKMRSDPLLRESILNSDLILADGMSVVWASRILGDGLPERVTGIDLFESLLGAAEDDDRSVYFLGASQEVLDELLARVRTHYPKLRIVGSRNGYFSVDEEPALSDEISRLAPHFLFVGISTPKKEIFLERWGDHMAIPVCHGVGGSFDVYAGKTSRAPASWQRMGIEWLYRVLQEPRRMWRRYLVTNTIFIKLVVSQWIHQRLHR